MIFDIPFNVSNEADNLLTLDYFIKVWLLLFLDSNVFGASLSLKHTYTGEFSHFSIESDSQTLIHSNSGDFHLPIDDKRHISPPNRNERERERHCCHRDQE